MKFLLVIVLAGNIGTALPVDEDTCRTVVERIERGEVVLATIADGTQLEVIAASCVSEIDD